jgi:glucosylceramidase
MMNRLSIPISGVWLAFCLIACGSEPSSTGQDNVGGASSTGLGGTSARTTGGNAPSTGGAAGVSGGTSAASTGGTIGAGGTSATTTGGTSRASGGSAAGTGGKVGATGGSSATSGGNAASGGTSAAGGTTGAVGGSTTASGGASSGNTGGKTGATGGAPSGGASTGVGGSATGGAQTGGGPAAPQLITSGQNDYFNTTHQATIVTSGTADVTVDDATKYQRWDGFGGTFNEMGWDALSVLSAAEITNALTLLFDPNDGANFIYGRLPMGASDYSTSWYTLDDTSSADYSMNSFSIARDEQKLIPFIKAALKIRSDIRLWASPWVVPSWMMDGSSNMKSDAQTLTAHALYMAKFVEEYAKKDLTIWAVHPQNEPGYARVHWTQANLINFMKTYLGPTFAQRNLNTEIWCGTMSKDPDDTNIALAAAKDADAMKYIKGFGVQWNPLAAVPTLAAKAPVMQTEHRCGNYNFTTEYWNSSQYSTSKAQNDHAYGEETWQLIRDWAVAGVNSYSAWNMVLDTTGKSLDGWPQDALLVVDRSTKKLIQTPAYFAFRQFSQFILPGATRIAVTSSSAALKGISTQTWNGLNALAFKNPDGRIVTQVYNKGTSAQTLTIKVGGTMYQISVPAHGWDTLNVNP